MSGCQRCLECGCLAVSDVLCADKKVQESRLMWYGHVLRRVYEYVGKRVMVMEVPGKRRRSIPKRRCLYNIRNDLSERIIRVASHTTHRPDIQV